MSAPRSAVIVHNPAARRVIPRARLEAAAAAMAASGWAVQVCTTLDADETSVAAREAATRGVDAILACGGDGTLNGVLCGVLAAGVGPEDLSIGVLPSGTANVWAHEAGVPGQLERALAMLDGGERRRADLGLACIGEGPPRPFLLMCGAGLDGRVVEAVDREPGAKRRLGRVAFVWPALSVIIASRPVEARVEVDGRSEQLRLHEAVAGNSRLYGGVMRLASAALVDDGALDLVTFEGRRGIVGRGHALGLALRALRGGLDRRSGNGIAYRRGSRIVIEPAEALPVQVDGEFIGYAGPGAALTLTVAPRAVSLIVGPSAGALFGGGES